MSNYIGVIALVILITGLVSAEEIVTLADGEKAFLLREYDKA